MTSFERNTLAGKAGSSAGTECCKGHGNKFFILLGCGGQAMLLGGVIMSLSGIPVCINPSLRKLPHTWRLGRTSQSLLNTYSQQPWAADLLNYFILLVLLTAATGALGCTTSWNFSYSRGLKPTKISSLLCSIIVISWYHSVMGTKSIKCGKAWRWSSLMSAEGNGKITFYRG